MNGILEIRFEYIISFVLAFIIAFFSTPLVKKLAVKLGAIDVPKDDRRMHKKPMALLGGLAIFIGFLMTILFNYITHTSVFFTNYLESGKFSSYALGVIIILVLGIIDDIRPLPARLKFLVQIIAAFIVVRFSDSRIIALTDPTNEFPFPLSNEVSIIISILWIVGVTNAINLSDGLDGLAAGVSAIAALSMFSIALINGQIAIAIMTIILAGSILGFLPYNFNPAKIFMGDTGSHFLGFTLGVLSIQGLMKTYTAIAIAIPLLILGLPIFDTAFAIIRRIIQKRPIGEADRGHIHHRLIDMGLSHKQSVSILYIISAVLGIISIVISDKDILPAIIFVIFVSIFIIGGTKNMNKMMGTNDVDNNKHTD